MEKISPRLKQKMVSEGPGEASRFALIITLVEDVDWNEGVRLLSEAGLRIESMAEEIRVVTGTAESAAIQSIAEISAIELIEMDEMASTMGPDSLS